MLDNYEESLPRKRVRYIILKKFQFTKEQLQEMLNDNPFLSARDITALHYKLYKIKITEDLVRLYLKDITRLSKNDAYRLKTIELRRDGHPLRSIFEKVFKLKNYEVYGKIFFRRIFKGDSLIKCHDISGKKIFKVVEEVYIAKEN